MALSHRLNTANLPTPTPVPVPVSIVMTIATWSAMVMLIGVVYLLNQFTTFIF